MSTPSLLLSCAGAAASLAGVWTLAGLSERSALLPSVRPLAAVGVGLIAGGVAFAVTPSGSRSELSLPLLFATAGVLALGVGAAKLEAALAQKDGPCVVRRASGIVAGTFFAMASVGAASLDLGQGSLLHARSAWALMFSLVVSALVVFFQRARYAGAGLRQLGRRAWLLGFIVVGLLVGAWLTRASGARAEAPPPPATLSSSSPSSAGAEEAPSAPPAPVSAVVSTAPVPAPPGQVWIDTVSVRGLLEADVRGGVLRRMDELQACLAEPQGAPTGALVVKVGIDATGSVPDSRPVGGDLETTPLAACLARVFYHMGFAAPPSGAGGFEITLRVGVT